MKIKIQKSVSVFGTIPDPAKGCLPKDAGHQDKKLVLPGRNWKHNENNMITLKVFQN